MIHPYPTVAKTRQIKKGRQLRKSRIYTDTREKNKLEEMQRNKKVKTIEQERRLRTKEIKRTLSFVLNYNQYWNVQDKTM